MIVSIIIPCYNAQQFLRRLLTELPRQTYPHGLIEVMIVDDASIHPVDGIIAEFGGVFSDFRLLQLVRHEHNHGRATTRNSGIINSTGDLLIFNDVDDIPEPDFIARVVARHATEPRIAVRGNIRVLPKICARSAYSRYRDSRFLGARKRRVRGGLDYNNLSPNFFATSGSSALRTDLLAVGLFDERFTGYGGEDEEMGYRLFQSGVRIVFEEQAIIWDGDDATTLERTCARYQDYGKLGTRLLFAIHTDYRRYSSFRWHEPINRQWDSRKVAVIKLVIRAMLRPALAGLFQRCLQCIDNWRLPLDPPGIIYKYVLRTFYQQGVRERPAVSVLFPSGDVIS